LTTVTALAAEIIHPWKRLFAPDYQGAELKRVATKTWSSISSSVKELQLKGPFEADLKHDCARLSVILDVVGDIPDARPVRGRPTPPIDATIHQMNYTPAGMPMWARSECTKYLSHINFTFSDDPKGTPVDDDDLIAQRLPPRLMFFDECILQLAKLFCVECNEEGPSDLLYGDGLGIALLARLAWLSNSDIKVPKRGGLSARELKQVTTYMHERLASQISLAELAFLIGTSRSYFGKAFRVSAGMPPHRWLMMKRLERAREYLLIPQMQIAHIAQLSGFTHQAHLTRVFSQILGTTPHAWRQLHNN